MKNEKKSQSTEIKNDLPVNSGKIYGKNILRREVLNQIKGGTSIVIVDKDIF